MFSIYLYNKNNFEIALLDLEIRSSLVLFRFRVNLRVMPMNGLTWFGLIAYEKLLVILCPILFCTHHHHVVLVARISLTLSRHFSLSFIASGRSSGQHPVSSHSCWMYVRAGRPVLHGHVWGSTRVHHLWVRPCFSSSVLHVWFI